MRPQCGCGRFLPCPHHSAIPTQVVLPGTSDVPVYWGVADDFPVEDWQYEVANGDTRLGYGEWVQVKRAQEAA